MPGEGENGIGEMRYRGLMRLSGSLERAGQSRGCMWQLKTCNYRPRERERGTGLRPHKQHQEASPVWKCVLEKGLE